MGGNRSAASSLEYTYVDDDEGVEAPTAESEDIYDEVYEDKISAVQILTGSGKCFLYFRLSKVYLIIK